ncbi:MAG TPA: Rho termination factor N-terminal domain-containing protein [Solirubrobacteraceae bacterium]
MAVLDRSELEASPLADLHAIADQIGLDGFRRLRKADLIDAILGESGESAEAAEAAGGDDEAPAEEEESPRSRRRRAPRLRRGRGAEREVGDEEPDAEPEPEPEPEADAEAGAQEEAADEEDGAAAPARPRSRRGGRSRGRGESDGRGDDRSEEAKVAEGVVEVLGNGSAFLRVDPPDASDEDVYISAAQVRRCELVSGDRVAGPVRTPRRSERYSSLVKIDTINGAPADTVSDGARYEDLPVAWPAERLALGSDDKTLEAIEWLTPLGKGSRATIAGPRGAGKSQTLKRLFDALKGAEGLELSVVLAGARPEEIADWQQGESEVPGISSALSFAASADSQAQALERALDAARRVAARGGDAVVLVDGLDGLHPQAARRALAAARNLREAGSLTVIATVSAPLGGETTVIALDPALAASGGEPILDLGASGTLRAELLVGEDGAEAIRKARAAALEGR